MILVCQFYCLGQLEPTNCSDFEFPRQGSWPIDGEIAIFFMLFAILLLSVSPIAFPLVSVRHHAPFSIAQFWSLPVDAPVLPDLCHSVPVP